MLEAFKSFQSRFGFNIKKIDASFFNTDNGCGLPNNKQLYENGGRGLISLSNRARMMGGFLEIHSEPNKGTILEFEIPI